jgi:hypothetical protein
VQYCTTMSCRSEASITRGARRIQYSAETPIV